MASYRIGFCEGKACDAIIRVLEQREKAGRRKLFSPEKDGHAAPVELSFVLNDTLFALEHTGIEPFIGHVQVTARAIRDLVPVQDLIRQRLDLIEHVLIEVPEAGLLALKRPRVDAFQQTLASWVVENLSNTEIAKFGRYPNPHRPYDVPGIPFPVWVHRMETVGHKPFVRVSVQIDQFDRDKSRHERIKKACDDKFPKLGYWKKEGARTVLVLEDNDIQFTNQSVVAESLLAVVKNSKNTPDEIWLVITCTEPWFVFPMLVDGRSYFEYAPVMYEFEPGSLSQLTER